MFRRRGNQALRFKKIMLNSTQHEISIAHEKLKCQLIKTFLAISVSDVVFIML